MEKKYEAKTENMEEKRWRKVLNDENNMSKKE